MDKNMKMNPGVWFEIPVTDLERAEAFYSAVFGVEFTRQPAKDGVEMSWFPMVDGMETYGAAGALMKHEMAQPSMAGTTIYLSIDSIEEGLERVVANGGEVVLPKVDIGEHGWFALFKDTEGNKVAMHKGTE